MIIRIGDSRKVVEYLFFQKTKQINVIDFAKKKKNLDKKTIILLKNKLKS
jgi:hypothetical protein